jgi:hypothetical protein
MSSLLNAKMSFEIAALIVSWLAIALLTFVVGNLLVRLQRLEQAIPAAQAKKPYGHLLGKQLRELLGESLALPQTQAIFFLSSTCKSCAGLLDAIRAQAWDAPVALAWTDGDPASATPFPSNVTALKDGARISAELGVRVTPFAVVANADGQVIKAGPINNLKSLGNLLAEPANFQIKSLNNSYLKEVSG